MKFDQDPHQFKKIYKKNTDNLNNSRDSGNSCQENFCETILKINTIDEKIGDLEFETVFGLLNEILEKIPDCGGGRGDQCQKLSCLGRALARVEVGFSEKFDPFNGKSISDDQNLIYEYFRDEKNWPEDFCYLENENINNIECAAQIFARIKAGNELGKDPVTGFQFQDKFGKFDPNMIYNYYSHPVAWTNFCQNPSNISSPQIGEILTRIEISNNQDYQFDVLDSAPIKGDMSLYNYYSTPRIWKELGPKTKVLDDVSVLCLAKIASRIISDDSIKFDPFAGGLPVGKSHPLETYNFYANPENWKNFCCDL